MGYQAPAVRVGLPHHKDHQGRVLADFTAEWTEPPEEDQEEETTLILGKVAPGLWTMNFDGAFSRHGAGAGIVLTSHTGDKLFYAV